MDDPALFMPHLEFTQNLGLTPRDVSPKGGHASQATPVAALAPHPCSRAIHPSIQPLAVPPCAGGLPCGPIGVTENLRRKPRATGYLHLSPTSHAALSPRPSQAPRDRSPQTPTPCGIPLHKPSRPARQVTFASPSINHAALILRDGSPHISSRFPLRQPTRPRPANAFAAQDSLTYSPRHPARRDTFASPPCPRPCPPFPRIRWRPFPRARDSRAAMRIACRGGRARRVKRPLKG